MKGLALIAEEIVAENWQIPIASLSGQLGNCDLKSLDAIAASMRAFIRQGLASLPQPGSGATTERWRILAEVGARDLSLAKIFESHADAQAILCELEISFDDRVLMAVWAAEIPGRPLVFDPRTSRVTGRKEWCSGAAIVEEGLLTAQTPDGNPILIRVKMDQPGITILPREWSSEGMARAGTTSILFQETPAIPAGKVSAYLDRPGFWQGGAGIAAVWYGGAIAVAQRLLSARQIEKEPHSAAHLGFVYSQLQAARAALLTTAAWIDSHPLDDAMVAAFTLRAIVENAAEATLQRTRRALGAGPLCTEPEHARKVADLEIYLRQSHAERDLATLGRAVNAENAPRFLW